MPAVRAHLETPQKRIDMPSDTAQLAHGRQEGDMITVYLVACELFVVTAGITAALVVISDQRRNRQRAQQQRELADIDAWLDTMWGDQ